ncbi:uncharacterized protein BX663DRAFT_542075 [Cokeromyces recurvatus]|uniref:uncharacterized protein n=1 Tax=Cokeromyces recurvatus TaxID=90255 RepID=UPI00221E4F06|nr:uncharacterized protein BX663DRAFT_542075 [Cokeromyces recurvatus]KAI7904413.1 hypothetical protein BX663DRAFT_542075 [Cokeromyces recurvatus]
MQRILFTLLFITISIAVQAQQQATNPGGLISIQDVITYFQEHAANAPASSSSNLAQNFLTWISQKQETNTNPVEAQAPNPAEVQAPNPTVVNPPPPVAAPVVPVTTFYTSQLPTQNLPPPPPPPPSPTTATTGAPTDTRPVTTGQPTTTATSMLSTTMTRSTSISMSPSRTINTTSTTTPTRTNNANVLLNNYPLTFITLGLVFISMIYL